VSWTGDADGFTVHRLVQEITRQRLPDDQKHDTLDLALAILNGVPSPDWDQKGWRLWEQLAPHCRTLLNRLRAHILEPKATRIMNELATWLNNRAEHGEAESLYRRALAVYEKSLGPEHPNVATGLNNLASLLYNTNRLAEAEPLSRRHLRILAEFGHRTGHEHPHFRTAINNYAGLLSSMGLSEAEILARLRSATESEPKSADQHPAQTFGAFIFVRLSV
jgi:tetratricopeptide (TPR) repeat protein